MKKTKLLLLMAIAAIFIITSCGKDGLDGKATIKFDWDWYVDTYWDSNPGVPTTISKMIPYSTLAGTYTYEYDCSDYTNTWGWYGTYTIDINIGEEGGFLSSGDDGLDRDYMFWLRGSGTTMSYTEAKDMAVNPGKPELTELTKSPKRSDAKKIDVGEPFTEVFYTENAKITVVKQKFIYE